MDEPRAYPFRTDALTLDPVLETLRGGEPVAPVRLPFGEDAVLATRHDDVRTVLSDPRFSRAAGAERDQPRTMKDIQAVGLVALDPPEHTRLRALVTGAFTHRRIEALRGDARTLAAGLARDMVAGRTGAELSGQFARPLTHTLIADLLGVPRRDQDRFQHWSDVGLSTTAHSPEYKGQVLGEMWEYLDAAIRDRQREPADDLLGTMAATDGGRRDIGELIILAMTVLVAGYETTASQITNFVLALLERPELLERVRADPSLVPVAVEELLRWVPLEGGPGPARYTTEPVELGGTTLPAGCPVLVDTASANHDAAAFPDPDTIDLDRPAVPHVAFGYGAHRCLGAHLARMLLQVALETLLTELPPFEIDPRDGGPRWKAGTLVRALDVLPVRW